MPLQPLQPRSAAHAALMQGQALATQPQFGWVLLPQPHGAAALPGAPLAGCLPACMVCALYSANCTTADAPRPSYSLPYFRCCFHPYCCPCCQLRRPRRCRC
jgi:hypothetical protein